MSEQENILAAQRKRRWLAIVLLTTLIVGGSLLLSWFYQAPPLRAATKTFLIEPYLQPGRNPDMHHRDIRWASFDGKSPWTLMIEDAPGHWTSISPNRREVTLDGVPTFYIYDAEPTALPEGVSIPYKVTCKGEAVFTASINPIRAAGEPYRMDVFGDAAYGSEGAEQVAYAVYQSHPDLVLVAGDIVYRFGRALEYLDHFFPVYNNSHASLTTGAPLLRSTLMVASPGNHDISIAARSDVRNLDQFPDGLAYFMFWKQPMDGPKLAIDGPNTSLAEGSPAHVQAFLKAAGDSYPSMTNFSFEEGNSHWTILDANPYMDWTNKGLRDWLENDLKTASKAQWKFVLFHQPGFNSDTHHAQEQRMRLVADIFQRNKVDIVFAGHVHNYQRSLPLKFQVKKQLDGKVIADTGEVDGTFALDRNFDGAKNKNPDGVIYIITGCGGARLSGTERQSHPEEWQPFTQKLISQYSFTQCDVKGAHLSVSQITPAGAVLDHFEISK